MPKNNAKPRQQARSRAPETGGAPASRRVDLDDDALLDIVQKQTLRYFWDFTHPAPRWRRDELSVLETAGRARPGRRRPQHAHGGRGPP